MSRPWTTTGSAGLCQGFDSYKHGSPCYEYALVQESASSNGAGGLNDATVITTTSSTALAAYGGTYYHVGYDMNSDPYWRKNGNGDYLFVAYTSAKCP